MVGILNPSIAIYNNLTQIPGKNPVFYEGNKVQIYNLLQAVAGEL
jgi:hypothetical protein